MKRLLLVTTLLFAAARLLALGAPARPAPKARAINVSAAKTFRVDFARQYMAQLVGNARVQDGGLIITAPQINVMFEKKSRGVQEIRAFGGTVRIEHNRAQVGINAEQPVVAICKEAVYVEAKREITLAGPVTMNGKGRPDSKILGFKGTTEKVTIELYDEGAVFTCEGASEFEILIPDEERPKGKSAEKKDK